MMNELNTQFPGILLGYVSNVGYHLSSNECNELTKLWSHNEYNYDQLKAENERLKEALKKIVYYAPLHKTSWDLDDQAIVDIAKKSLEVTK